MNIQSIREMTSRLTGRPMGNKYGSGTEEWDAEYVEKTFLSKLNAALTDNGYLNSGELAWGCADPPCSIKITKTFYKGLGSSYYDRATLTLKGSSKILYWPMPPTGDVDTMGYLNHLDAMCDDLLARGVAMQRGMLEALEEGKEPLSRRQLQILADKAASALEKKYKGASIVGLAVGSGTKSELWLKVREKKVTPARFSIEAEKITDGRWNYHGKEHGAMVFKSNVAAIAKEDVDTDGEVLEEGKLPSDGTFRKMLKQNNYAKFYGFYPTIIANEFGVSEKEAKVYLDRQVKKGNLTVVDGTGSRTLYRPTDTGTHKPRSVPNPKKDSRSKRLRGLDKVREVAAQRKAGAGRKKEKIDAPGSLWDGAEVVSEYSRKQAIRDGGLVDVTKYAKEDGFRFPTAFTRSLWHVVSRIPKSSDDDLSGRLHDLFSLMRMKIRGGGSGSRMKFRIKIGRKNHDLVSVVGPGDTPAPVMTVGYPRDF